MPAKKASKAAPRKRFSARPKMDARYDMYMYSDEKTELEEATLRLGYPSLARFLVAAGLRMARETKPRP